MNKINIILNRISCEGVAEVNDYVAVEKTVLITQENGRQLEITCSPGFQEEMILGRKITSGTESNAISETCNLKQADIDVIFDMARKTIVTPGELFNATGCVHSCALVHNGEIICHMEDIKRHNALDKAVGYAAKNNIPLTDVMVVTSGRVSLDYMEKVINAGIGIVVSRAAVTDAAISLAKKKDVTLLGFVRNGRANLYHEGRVKLIQEEE